MELQFPFYYNISIFLQSTASDFRQPQLTLPGRGSYNGDEDHQGRHLRIPFGETGVQRLKVYRY